MLLLLSYFLILVPYIGAFLCLVAWVVAIVLLVLAFRRISELYGRPDIFKNVLIWIGLSILASIFVVFVAIIALVVVFALFATAGGIEELTGVGIAALALLLLFLIAGWVVFVASAFFFYKATAATAEVTSNDVFKLAGLAYLAGAVLAVVLIGSLVLFIAEILLVVAFFTLKPTQPQPGPSESPAIQL